MLRGVTSFVVVFPALSFIVKITYLAPSKSKVSVIENLFVGVTVLSTFVASVPSV